MDPIAFRRLNIADDQWLFALDAAARGANWQPRVMGSFANFEKSNGFVGSGRPPSLACSR